MTAANAVGISLRPAAEQNLTGMAQVHRAAFGLGHFHVLLPVITSVAYYHLFLNKGSSQASDAEIAGETAALGGLAGFGVLRAHTKPRIREFKRDRWMAILRTELTHPLIAGRKVALGIVAAAWRCRMSRRGGCCFRTPYTVRGAGPGRRCFTLCTARHQRRTNRSSASTCGIPTSGPSTPTDGPDFGSSRPSLTSISWRSQCH